MAKKEEKKQLEVPEKKYPSRVLGLDISTACIGISIVYDDGVNEPVVEDITHIAPKVPRSKKGIEALIMRKEIFEKVFLSKIKDRGVTECVIESPIQHSVGGSTSAQTIAQLLQFNGLLSEAVYRVLGIIPYYISSYDARMLSFPQLMSVRKFNKKGEIYPVKHLEKALKDSHLVLFGTYPFDCDKKSIMMNLVSDKYPDIDWVKDKNGDIRKENFDACDSLICSLAYINLKRYGQIDASVKSYGIVRDNGSVSVSYEVSVWDRVYDKKLVFGEETG